MTIPYKIILITSILFNTGAMGFLGHLISFHVYLQKHKITTFEYIQQKQNRTNYKSKIFREVNHHEEEEGHEGDQLNKESQDDKSNEIHANIETDNVNLKGNFHKIQDEDSLLKDANEHKTKYNESILNSEA